MVEAPGERKSQQESTIPGREEECQHLLANAVHIHHQRQLVLPHGVGAQSDLAEEKSKHPVTPQSHCPCVRQTWGQWVGENISEECSTSLGCLRLHRGAVDVPAPGSISLQINGDQRGKGIEKQQSSLPRNALYQSDLVFNNPQVKKQCLE